MKILVEPTQEGTQPAVVPAPLLAALSPPETEQRPSPEPAQVSCADSSVHCVSWAADGQCTANQAYMEVACALSCRPECAAQQAPPPPPPAPPPPPPAAPAPPPYHLPPAPPRERCYDADRSSFEEYWDHGIVDLYSKTAPATCTAAESSATLKCDTTTGLYCEATKLRIDLFKFGDPHLSIDCADGTLDGKSAAEVSPNMVGFGFHIDHTAAWAPQLIGPALPRSVI